MHKAHVPLGVGSSLQLLSVREDVHRLHANFAHLTEGPRASVRYCTQSGPRSGSHSVLEVTMLSIYMCSILEFDFVLQGGILNLLYFLNINWHQN